MDNLDNNASTNDLPQWKLVLMQQLEKAKNEKVLAPVTFKKQIFLFFGRIAILLAVYIFAGDIDWLKWVYVIGGLTTVTSISMYFMVKYFVQKKIAKLEAQLAEQPS